MYFQPGPLITASALLDLIEDPDIGIVDCRFSLNDPGRGRSEWLKATIPGSRYAHLDEDLSGPLGNGSLGRHPMPGAEDVLSLRNAMGFGDDTFIICFDDAGGPFAARLWWMLRWIGHEAVAVLDGGLEAWFKVGGLTTPGQGISPQSATPGSFGPTASYPIRNDMIADAQDLLQGNGTPIDARARERFLGATEPIDPIAGHIPGAISMPWMDNLDQSGFFLSKDQLTSRWQDAGGTRNAISYCGSGVTACHNILTAAIADLSLPKLYPPSWSGWISDPERPIESGSGRELGSKNAGG